MNYSATQIEKAKREYNSFLNVRTVESYEPQYIGYAAAEQRCEYHNKLVAEIKNGNVELEKEWKMFFLNEAVKADEAANRQKDYNKGVQDNLTSIAKELNVTKKALVEVLKKNQKLYNNVRFKGYRDMEVIKSMF